MRYFSENDIDLNHLIQHDKQGNMKTLPGTFNVNDYSLVSRKNCIMHLAWHFKWYCVTYLLSGPKIIGYTKDLKSQP